MSNSPPIKTAMISSTSVDLPEHRKQVIDACLREGLFPIAMEHLPSRDADAIRVSLEMVDKADVYVGVYAWRYGHVPDGSEISITEMEFDRAVERKIPILVFLIHKDHTLTINMVEADKVAQEKLEKLKQRASQGRGRLEFHSPVDLRSHVIQSLSALVKEADKSSDEKSAISFHPPNIIPAAPQPYIAHPYLLLQTAKVIGRHAELNLLTDWVTTNAEVPASVRLFNLVAIGGMGKSALTWKWFNDIAPHELPNRVGWMWWSFYESDAHYENFIIRALAYTSRQAESAVRELNAAEREDQLWRLLDEQPFVFVLDGLERILLAYARIDAARMLDDDLDDRTANRVAHALGLPESAAQSFIGKHQLRSTADRRAGQFLRRLTQVRASRLLISTRLYPAEIQADTGDPLPGCFAAFLRGLRDDDALTLWRELKVSGSREELLPVFQSFGNYPLLIRALAGEVAAYRPAPRNFYAWRQVHAEFNPAGMPLNNAKTHVLEYALRGLGEKQREVLHTLAAFRMPAPWETLRALLSGIDKPCSDDQVLDTVLTELEDRGLIGWDKQANRYDLHPIVRSVVWAALAPEARQGLYRELHIYFDAAPRPPVWENVENVEDLTSGVELFDKLIGLERYQDAYVLFRDHLESAMLYRLNASRLRADLLERLFPDGVDAAPKLETARSRSYTLNAVALAYHFIGEPGRAAPLMWRAAETDEKNEFVAGLALKLRNLAVVLWPSGQLRKAESVCRRALGISLQECRRFDEGICLIILGVVLATRGETAQSAVVLRRAKSMFSGGRYPLSDWITLIYLSQNRLFQTQGHEALYSAQRAWELAHSKRLERDFILAARMHGEAALALGDLATAEERLDHAVTRARAVNLVEEELPAYLALAELRRQKKQYDVARELLEQVSAPAERGPYPLWNADALNILAQIECEQMETSDGAQRKQHLAAAITAAGRAFELAWCDGPPYAYHYGLTKAKQLLAELGAPEPQLRSFDESKYEPMPDVEPNPQDGFWVEPEAVDSGI